GRPEPVSSLPIASMARRSAALLSANFEKSWLKARWMTPSARAAPCFKTSVSSIDPCWTSAPAATRTFALSSDRHRPTTECPAASSSFTTAEPMNPVAPVTNTRMMFSPRHDGRHHGFAFGVNKAVALYGYRNQQDAHGRHRRKPTRQLPQGVPHETRSGNLRFFTDAPAHAGPAPRRSGTTRARQRDLVHVAGTRARRRAFTGDTGAYRGRVDADRCRTRAPVPAGTRPTTGNALPASRRRHAPAAKGARRADMEPCLREDLDLGRGGVEPRRRGSADRLRQAAARATQHPAAHVPGRARACAATGLARRRAIRCRHVPRRRGARGCIAAGRSAGRRAEPA